MKKVIFSALLLIGLVGCSNADAENTTINVVKGSLKDPDSAKFQNINGACGEVNAKNSYGAYPGFKKFYISSGVVVFEDLEDENIFSDGYAAYCTSGSTLTDPEKQGCVDTANAARMVLQGKQMGISKDVAFGVVEKVAQQAQGSPGEKDRLYKMIESIYGDPNATQNPNYTRDILNKCLAG